MNGFRLTTESGVPVSTSDRSAQGTIYLTPFLSNVIALYTGSVWRLASTAEISLALAVASGSNYDVFAYLSGNTVVLELSAAWTNDSTRADAFALQNGVWVKSGTPTRRWVGTIRGSGANVTADSARQPFVYNANNRVLRLAEFADETDFTYATAVVRQWRATATNQLEILIGDPNGDRLLFTATVWGATTGAAGFTFFGIGIDTTTAYTASYDSGLSSVTTGVIPWDIFLNHTAGTGYFYASLNQTGGGGAITQTCRHGSMQVEYMR